MSVASVIIPAYGRLKKLERAIFSVLRQPGADEVEIIVVDDGSVEPLSPSCLRSFDRLIRNGENLGAAVSRNIGIEAARGEWIFLLDSDDVYLNVDFTCLNHLDRHALYFSSVKSQGWSRHYPKEIGLADYFHYIFCKYKSIAQTSSLFFHRDNLPQFDENLPKHQDWDFVYFQFLNVGKKVLHSDFTIFFDRSDKVSLSRRRSIEKSIPWYKKLESTPLVDKFALRVFRYKFFSDRLSMRWFIFFYESVYLLLNVRITFVDFLKCFFRRYI